MAAPDPEKFEKLREKYNQLRQAKEVLRNGLLAKQEECVKLEKQLKEKDNTLRQQLEEIDHLQYQNSRMSKQLGALTAQVEEQQKKTQDRGWSVGGLISGKQQQETIQKAEEEIRILRDELMMKIQENEELHMQLFEEKKSHDDEAHRLKEASASTCGELERRSADLEAERLQSSRFLSENQDMTTRIATMDGQLSVASNSVEVLQGTLEHERCQGRHQVETLNAKYRRWVPFDEGEHEPWNHWNTSSQQGRGLVRRSQAVQELQSSVLEACKQSSGVLQNWTKTFGGGSDEESAKRLQVRTKMSDTVQSLAALISQTVPDMVRALNLLHSRPSPTWDEGCKKLLQTHRKWVSYQSLLLLHNCNSAYGTRSAQEEKQAQNFVDSLWRLHRCVRTLFSKLRLFTCTLVLMTRRSSSQHFGLANKMLRGSTKHDSSETVGLISAESNSPEHRSASLLCIGNPKGDIFIPCPRSASVIDTTFPPASLDEGSLESRISSTKPPQRANRSASADLAADSQMELAPQLLLECLKKALKDVSQCWEVIGRCLSSWATAHASDSVSQDGNAMVELLESLHRFCACLTERVTPAVDHIASDAPWSMSMITQHAGTRAMVHTSKPRPADCINLSDYLSKAFARLRQAPGGIGFAESVQTQLKARRLSAERSRIQSELQQQVRWLQAVLDEKATLVEELRALQDNYAVLQSNWKVVQQSEHLPRAPVATPTGVASERPVALGTPSDLVLSSRQRALLESLSVTAQENLALRQHGFFIDVISLSAGEVALAAGPPDGEAPETWEAAVRKVYEQHCRSLQKQVKVADGKAIEFQLSVQDSIEKLRVEEEVKGKLRDEVGLKRTQLQTANEDMVTTRKNYDQQMAVLTEHICTLSVQISDKDASLAALQAQKILCGHCGMWNIMGKLLSQEAGGICQTCKEKVVSRG